jgi:hypothetical protein
MQMKTSVKPFKNDTEEGKRKYSEENLSNCQFFQHKLSLELARNRNQAFAV